jgi:aspartyl-tRNA(Asn)/glutamyl-tRNA(Gln) amidotransferase subunit A
MSALAREDFFQSVADLGPQIKRKQISPVDLTEAYLDRLETLGPRYNALAALTRDVALEQARAAESEISRDRYRGPLHGIPYGAKDLLATENIPTTWGAAPCKGQMFDHDATVVRRLRDAGAVLVGKLAMVEFAGGLGYRWAHASLQGPGLNPWDTKRWTGGSSSGSGAAVSAGLAGFAIGTETWGSILCPAAFCGITGLRPTYGRVSRYGGMVCASTFDKIGPMARSAADCRFVLEAIAGHDPLDPSSSHEPVALSSRSGRPIEKLRGALIESDFTVKGAEPEVKVAFERAVEEVRAMGLRLEVAKLPEFPAAEVAGLLISAEAISNFESFYRDGTIDQLSDPYARYQPEVIQEATPADLVKAWRLRLELQKKTREFFTRYDVIVGTNFLSAAPPIDRDLYETLPYGDPVGAVGNACGLPSIALPCGLDKRGLPIGFQIMGAPFDEATLLRLGESYQKRTEYHRLRPREDA